MKPDTTLNLGDFQFAGLEIPANIPFGGSQRLAVHKLIGGAKVVDAMGRDDKALTWSGFFMGSTAADRARYLDTLRVGGQQLTLTWSTFNYLVVVREFSAKFEKAYQIPYTITCEVVQDNTSPITAAGAPPVDSALGDDATSASTLAGTVGDPTLSTLTDSVVTSVSSVPSFTVAPQSLISIVQQSIAAAQSRVGVLAALSTATVAAAPSFGAVVPGAPVAVNAAAIGAQVSAMQQLDTLAQLTGVLGRMQGNLRSINSSQRTVATAGGNLFTIATQQYGDASAWTALAKANGLTDPFIQGTAVLSVPPQGGDTTGVLNA